MTVRRARRSLIALVAGHTVSRTGNVVALFAIPFSVIASGGGALEVGIAAAATTAPVLIGGPLGGVLVDRIGYVRSAVLADVISGVTIALIPLWAAFFDLPFAVLLLLVFLGGLLDAPGETARRVLLPGLTTEAAIPLERSVGFLDGATRASTLLGAPLAAVLVAVFGAFPALFVTAAAFGVSALITGVLVKAAPSALPDESEKLSYWSDLRAGFVFVVRDPLLRLLVLMVLVTNTLDAAKSGTLLPLYAHERLDGPASLGLIVGVFGGAALVGTIVFGYVAARLPRRIPYVICFTLVALSALPPALGLDTGWMVATSAVAGFAAGAINPILGAVQLERIPPHMRARVFGLITAGAWAGMPLGGLLGGLSAGLLGLTVTFSIVLVVYVIATLAPLTGGPWRLMERDRIGVE